MAASDSRVERSTSVSSMRRMNVPPVPRASSQLNSAVRALPTCSWPVGLGAKRTRMTIGISASGLNRARSSATACAAIASPRPTASTPSLVLPLMLTRGRRCRARRRRARASRRRTARIFGARGSTVTSTLPTRSRCARRARRRARSRSRLDASFHRGSVSGKCRPMSPRPAAPRIASVTAWQTTSASEWPSAPRSDGIVTPPSISGRPATRRCRS